MDKPKGENMTPENLFGVLTVMSFLFALPLALIIEGPKAAGVFATAAAGIGEIEISSEPSEMTVASQDWSPALTTTRRATMSSGDALTRRDTRRESHTETGGVTT